MLDRWAIGAIVLLGLVCLFSTYVALDVWLPDRRERARIRAERAAAERQRRSGSSRGVIVLVGREQSSALWDL